MPCPARPNSALSCLQIGDAYMVVGGLPDPVLDHARRVANFALEALEVAQRVPVNVDDLSKGAGEAGACYLCLAAADLGGRNCRLHPYPSGDAQRPRSGLGGWGEEPALLPLW